MGMMVARVYQSWFAAVLVQSASKPDFVQIGETNGVGFFSGISCLGGGGVDHLVDVSEK